MPLGSLLASLLVPHGRPNRPKLSPRGTKIAPSCPSKASRPAKMIVFLQNQTCSNTIEKRQEDQLLLPPKPAQNRPKMAPSPAKMARDRPKTAQCDLEEYFFVLEHRLQFCIVSGSFWGIDVGSLCPPKGLLLGTLLAFKIEQKINPKSDCSQSPSKIALRPPKTLPRCPPDPQDTLTCAPGAPRTPPDTP